MLFLQELETRRQSEDMHSNIATGLKKHVNIEAYRKARLANGKVIGSLLILYRSLLPRNDKVIDESCGAVVRKGSGSSSIL